MPGLVPGISLSLIRRTLGERMDGRDKPGHDVLGFPAMHAKFSIGTLALGSNEIERRLTLGGERVVLGLGERSDFCHVTRPVSGTFVP